MRAHTKRRRTPDCFIASQFLSRFKVRCSTELRERFNFTITDEDEGRLIEASLN